MKPIIITIDGYSSCGKSTLARQLAKKLNYIFIDSGAMYRAITLYFLRENINISDPEAVHRALQHIHLSFERNAQTNGNEIILNGENVSTLIREMNVSNAVSEVSTIREVREFAVAQQQRIGERKGLVMDGRDIGTTVFPQAELKIFMTADNAVRTLRRYVELKKQQPDITLDEVKRNLEKRDYIDSHREVSPLRKADDALVLDNTILSPEDQLQLALDWVQERQQLTSGVH